MPLWISFAEYISLKYKVLRGCDIGCKIGEGILRRFVKILKKLLKQIIIFKLLLFGPECLQIKKNVFTFAMQVIRNKSF